MATSVITGTILSLAGTALAAVTVTCKLKPYGFKASTGASLAHQLTTVTDASGIYTFTLERTADISPSNTYYEIEEQIPVASGGRRVWAITVGAGNATVFASLITNPPPYLASSYLTRAQADALYAGPASIGVFAAAYGVVGDGITDDTAAVQAALTAGAGGYVWFQPNAVHLISAGLNVSSNTKLMLGGATLKGKASTNFGNAGLLQLAGVHDVEIHNGILDGNKANNAAGNLFGIKITGGSSRVRIAGAYCKNFPGTDGAGTNGGDGIYINQGTDVRISDVICDANVRTGMAVVNATRLKVVDSVFSNTTGSATGAGVDIEPGSNTDTISDVTFEQCSFFSNGGVGVALNNNQQGTWVNVRLVNCDVKSNGSHGVYIYTADTSVVIGGQVVSNSGDGIQINNCSSRGARVENVLVQLNTANGVNILSTRLHVITGNQILSNAHHGIQQAYVSSGDLNAVLSNNVILNNGTGAATTYDGINFLGNVTHDNFSCQVVGNMLGNQSNLAGAAQQRYGIYIATNTQRVHMIGNQYRANASGDVSYNGAACLRVEIGATDAYGVLLGSSDSHLLGLGTQSGFNGHAVATPPTLPADGTDAGTVLTLVNAIKSLLKGNGLGN